MSRFEQRRDKLRKLVKKSGPQGIVITNSYSRVHSPHATYTYMYAEIYYIIEMNNMRARAMHQKPTQVLKCNAANIGRIVLTLRQARHHTLHVRGPALLRLQAFQKMPGFHTILFVSESNIGVIELYISYWE